MPDLSLTELVLGGLTALFGGGAGASVAHRRVTVTDVERRAIKLEKRLAQMEDRMLAIERTLASLSRVSETTDRTWRAIEAVVEKLDKLSADVVKLHVETTIDREIRKQLKQEEDTEP